MNILCFHLIPPWAPGQNVVFLTGESLKPVLGFIWLQEAPVNDWLRVLLGSFFCFSNFQEKKKKKPLRNAGTRTPTLETSWNKTGHFFEWSQTQCSPPRPQVRIPALRLMNAMMVKSELALPLGQSTAATGASVGMGPKKEDATGLTSRLQPRHAQLLLPECT